MKKKNGITKRIGGFFLGRTVEERKGARGFLFILPWVIGVIWFFIVPMVEAMFYVFCQVEIRAGGVTRTFVGLSNLNFIFAEDPEAIMALAQSVGQTLLETAIILVFSLVVALILNQEFPGRTFSRAIFALPILVSSGVVLSIFQEDLFTTALSAGTTSTIFQADTLTNALKSLGLGSDVVDQLSSLIGQALDLMWKSGVQILLFVAGLNAVPPQLYEVCSVEGATAWQTLWKVTFPLVTPFILLNVLYTIIDSFTFFSNPVIKEINALFVGSNYSYSTTLSMAYCLLVLVVTGIVGGLLSRKVFYMEK